jgi:hypothetical protein
LVAEQVAGRYGLAFGTAFVLAVALAGCATTRAPVSAPSASASRPSPSPSRSAVDYSKQYLADVTSLNNADDAASKALTNKQNIMAYTQLSGIEQSTAAKMLRQAWPVSAEADIQAFAEALSVESGDDADVAGDFKIDPTAHSTGDKITYTLSASSMSNDTSRDDTDSNKSIALAQKCRADLGLPPVS